MNKVALLLFLTIILIPAPKEGMNVSLMTGINIAQHYGVEFGHQEYKVDKGIRVGMISGISTSHPISDILTIRQDFLYINKGSTQNISIIDQDISFEVKYNTNYLEIPTCIKLYKFRGRRLSLYTTSGFSFAYMLNSHYTIDGKVVLQDDSYPLKVDKSIDYIDVFDYGVILGGGLEYQPKRLNRFRLDYRVSFGIPFIDLPTTEDVTIEGNHIDDDPERVKLRNLSYSISLGYSLF